MSAFNLVTYGAAFPYADAVVIGNDAFPGKATVSGLNGPRGWEVRKGYGQSGATVVPTGDELSTFSILFEIWDPLDALNFYRLAAKYFDRSVKLAPGGKTPLALAIFHPVLAAPPFRISAVVVKDVTGFEQDDLGLWTCNVSFLQYRKPKPAPAKPAAVYEQATDTAPTAVDKADAELEAKLATLARLRAQ